LMTNADLPGVERLTISEPLREYGLTPSVWVEASEVLLEASDLASAGATFMIKGWSRSMAATVVMLAAFENQDFAQVA
ncbi:unnamed protein product, partial [Symbiodinium sp. CCMP2592]